MGIFDCGTECLGNDMPTYEDPGCFCKFFCPPCAVMQAQCCCKCPEMLGACLCCCLYTMTCWDPTAGKPGGAPEVEEMQR